MPTGFKIERFAEGLSDPRVLKVAPNGDIFVAETGSGQIRVLRAADGAASPSVNEIFAGGLNEPFGIAFFPNGDNPQWVYVANTDSVVRFAYRAGDVKARGQPGIVVPNLPAGGHSTRNIVFTQGRPAHAGLGRLGKQCRGGIGPPPGGLAAWSDKHPLGAAWSYEQGRAAVLSFDPDGKNPKLFATGIRNCVGLAISPADGAPWCATNERDGLGDHLVPDYITHVEEGGFYGWPWYYIGANQDPRHEGKRPELKDKVIVPDVLLQSHSASLDLTFYDGDQFPRGLPRRCLRRRARLVEPAQPDRLQGDPRPSEGRQGRPANTRTSSSASSPTRATSGAGRSASPWPRRRADGHRRRQRHHLARQPLGSRDLASSHAGAAVDRQRHAGDEIAPRRRPGTAPRWRRPRPVPMFRPSGTLASRSAMICARSSCRATRASTAIGVFISPGRMTFARMPNRAYCRRVAR